MSFCILLSLVLVSNHISDLFTCVVNFFTLKKLLNSNYKQVKISK